ncbi:hypothetical protein QE374_000667 [Microbacterium sp. SORGH_AS428]|nr:hypothetical protein [Microbacterium sp. SORGH_AS_0428]
MKLAVTTQKLNEWATTDKGRLLDHDGSLGSFRDQLPHDSIHAGKTPPTGWLRQPDMSLKHFDVVERLDPLSDDLRGRLDGVHREGLG